MNSLLPKNEAPCKIFIYREFCFFSGIVTNKKSPTVLAKVHSVHVAKMTGRWCAVLSGCASLYAGRLIAEDKKTVMRKALFEFLIHGLPYVFPQKPGALVPGIPTAHSAPALSKEFKSDELYVWPNSKGELRGQRIEPFHHGQIKAVKQDKMLYELLALCDAMRVGEGA